MWVRIRRLIDRASLVRAAVSLILAFTLWGWVTIENNPEITSLVSGIPPTPTHLTTGLQISGQLPSVALRLQGPRSEINLLDPTKLKATVNLSSVKGPGDVTVSVQATAPGHIQVLDVYPPTILLHIETAPAQSDGVGGTPQAIAAPAEAP